MKYLIITDMSDNSITIYTGYWSDDFDFYDFIEKEGFNHTYCDYVITDSLDIKFKQYEKN